LQALTEIAPQLAAENCDHQVLLVHGSPDEARELARQFPQFDFICATGGAEEPPVRLEQIEGTNARLIECGHKGMYAIVIGLYDDPENPIRYQRVPLDARFADSSAMQQKLIDYQRELETLTLAGLGLKGSPHPNSGFVGSEACADCHTNAWAIFENTPHAHATDTLVNLNPPRHFDPECLSCHATGWNPQQYFPYETGFFGLDSTPAMTQNGCENCHGPGADHVAAENAGQDDVEKYRQQMVLTLDTARDTCLQCHDLDNSPAFHEQGAFEKYWERVKH
jgi:hypothetical protein